MTSIVPLPQYYVHIVPEQSHPASIVQLVQPSPGSTLPSSHYSPASNVPLPHINIHTLNYNGTALHTYAASTVHVELQPSELAVLPSSHYSVYE